MNDPTRDPPSLPATVEARAIPLGSNAAADPPLARPIEGTPASPMELPALSRRDAAFDLVLIVLVAGVTPFVVEVLLYNWTNGSEGTVIGLPTVLRKCFDALLVSGLAIFLLLRRRLPAASFGLRSDRPGRQLLWCAGNLVAVYGFLIASVFVILPLMSVFPSLQSDLENRRDFLNVLPIENLALTAMLLVPVAIHEEMLFRGLLLPYLRRVTGRWWAAIVISSAIFGFLHLAQGLFGAIQIAGVGMIFAYFFVRSRSLFAVIVAHFLFDFLQMQFVRVLPQIQQLLRAATQPS